MSSKCFHCKDDLWDDNDYEALEQENARLREALEFYAEYENDDPDNFYNNERARQAIKRGDT